MIKVDSVPMSEANDAKHFDLISIGSGSAGRKVAVVLKRAGWNTALVEGRVDDHFGGTCINTGCIPTKALVEAAHNGYSFTQAKEHERKIVERIRKGTLRHVEERVGVPVIRGYASFVDDHTIEVNGEKYSADYFVVATGSEPAIPPIKGIDKVNYSTNEDILKLEKPPKHLLIIGGGRIGLEFGQMLHKFGSDVTIFEGMPQILPGEDREMADALKEHLTSLGIKIFTGRFVDEVKEVVKDDGSREFEVHLYEGENAGVYKGDMLLVSTGRKPRIGPLKLENAGVEVEKGAIKVNEFLQTNKPHIFAIGDVVGNPMFTNWAAFQAGVLIKNLKKSKTRSDDWKPLVAPSIPRITFTVPELASVGLTEEEARERYGEKVVVYKFYNKWLGKSMIVNDWVGFLKGIGIKGSNEIIGAHLWGVRTASLVQMLVLARDNGLGWKELGEMIYGHPVLAEGIEALGNNMTRLTQAE